MGRVAWRARGWATAAGILVLAATTLAGAARPAMGVGGQAPPPAQRLFDEALQLEAAGDLEAALQSYQRLIDSFPAGRFPGLELRVAARLHSGDIHLRHGRGAAAAPHYLDALDLEHPSPLLSRARLELATIMLWKDQLIAAVELLQEVVAEEAAGGPAADASAARRARARLTLVHRLRWRPEVGRAPYETSRRLALPDLELDDPIGVAISPSGTLLIVDEGTELVALYELGADAVGRLPNEDVQRPWWGQDGVAYLPTREQGVFPLGLPRVDFAQPRDGSPRPLNELRAGARGLRGEWYLLDEDPPRLVLFAADGSFRRVVWGEDRGEPVDVAIDGRGRVYVLDRRGNNVLRFTADGELDGTVASARWDRAEAVAVDPLDNVYVLDRDDKLIDVFDPRGERIARLGPVVAGGVELDSPRDLAVDDSGRIFVADRDLGAVVVVE